LIKELESRLIAAQVSVSDADVSGYYQEHPDEFRPPERISVIALQGEMDTINNVVTEINQGLDFIQAGKKNNLTPIPILDTPTSELSPGLEAAIRELDIDGVSKSFEINNMFYVAKLQKREIQEPLPLEKFKGEIFAKLKKKQYSDLRREYIEILLKQSDVQVNRKVWEKLQAEYAN
jgi:peptidyl-prolyl cis-trans isomerase D